MDFEDLQQEREYDLDLMGNFGRFVSSGSYPVEFFMTSMPMAQANKYLKFATDVQMDDVNFDLLMQRDIDADRVENDIMPYLQQDEATASTRPVFFPPLLAAIVPVNDEKIQEFYGARSAVNNLPPGFSGVVWQGHFRLYGRETVSADGLSRRRQKLSATPDLSGTVLPLCLIPNSALKSAPPFKSVVPKASACAGLPA